MAFVDLWKIPAPETQVLWNCQVFLLFLTGRSFVVFGRWLIFSLKNLGDKDIFSEMLKFDDGCIWCINVTKGIKQGEFVRKWFLYLRWASLDVEPRNPWFFPAPCSLCWGSMGGIHAIPAILAPSYDSIRFLFLPTTHGPNRNILADASLGDANSIVKTYPETMSTQLQTQQTIP